MAPAYRYRFSLNIPARQWQRLYAGQVSQVLFTAHCGTRVQLPAAHFRRFVQHSGLCGHFELQLDSAKRFQALNRLAVNNS